MIYRYGRKLLHIGLNQFFRAVTVRGTACEEGPLLIVANHPNMALDPFLLTRIYQREVFFLAKSTLFRGPVISAVLRACNLIPVYRRMDNPSDSSKNRETFRVAVEALHGGSAVALFPEGVSRGVRKLEELKTGAARIAFQAEDGRDFKLRLRIQPVGITYSDHDLFQGTVTIVLGEPLEIAPYRGRYEADAVEAVRGLTAEIDQRLRSIVVDISTLEHEVLVEKIAKVYTAGDTHGDDFARFSEIARHVELLAPQLPEERREIERRIDTFLELSRSLGMEQLFTPAGTPCWFLVAMAAPALLGAVLHYPPYRSVEPVLRAMKTEPVAWGTMKFAIGIGVFGAWYLIVALVVWMGTGSSWWAVVSVLLMAITGSCANRYYPGVSMLLLSTFWPGRKQPLEVARVMHMQLIDDLNKYRG